MPTKPKLLRRIASLPSPRPAGAALLLALAPGVSHAQLPAGTWQYFWGDDFSGTTYDASKWQVGPDWGMSTASPTAVSEDKVHVADGVLTLEATRVKVNGSNAAGDEIFQGGMLSTYQRKNFNGGYIEARIWLPDTVGSWPAFWGLYDGWPPEMDIMEYPYGAYANDQYHTAFHYVNTGGGNSAGAGQVNPPNAGDLRGGWHTFGANWVDDTSVRYYFDGVEVSSFTNGTEVAEMVSMYLILNYAVGGWPAVPSTTDWPVGFTDETKVDWVRVWKSASASTTTWLDASGLSTDWKTWENGGSWSNGSPNLGGVTANFGTLGGLAERRIDIIGGANGNRTLSVVNFDGSTRYLIGWPGDRMVLGFGDNGTIQPTINVAATTTTDHQLWTTLEWSGNLNINNNSSHPLLLTGPVMGGDGINIAGPGVVSFDSVNNGYSGWTTLDPAGTGPGIARARGQNSLGTGLIRIGPIGNATTARLELENGALVANPIDLPGRNNDSAGIVNNSGSNTISGTISSQIGGSRYWIQSGAGHLELSGTSGGGVAIRSNSTGTRTFTLKGAGDGEVSGRIENGNAIVNLVKADAGTWTLGATNTYTGTTTVSGGTLVVDGTTGSGSTSLASGATLGGAGTVNGSFTAPSGSTVRPGAAGFTLASASPFTLLDNFDSYNNTADTHTTVATGGVWSSEIAGTNNSHVVDSDQGQSLQSVGGTAWRGAERDLTGTDAAVLVGETQTFFWQAKTSYTSDPAGWDYDFMMGLSPSVGDIDGTDAWADFSVMPFINNEATTPYINASGPGTYWAPMNPNQWYNVWVVVDNDAVDPTFDLYYSTGANPPTLVISDADWRNFAAGVDLNAIGFMAAGNPGNEILVDNIYYAPGEELQNPLDFVGAPLVPVAETLNVGGTLTMTSGSTLELDVSTGALHDKLVTGGAFSAYGTLKVTLDPAQAAPVLGDSFDLFDSAGGVVNFASYDLPALAEGLTWDTSAISTGVLSVVTDPTTYAGWAMEQPFPPGTDAPDFDAEPDGIPNAFEWLLDSDPLVSDVQSLPSGEKVMALGGEFAGVEPSNHYLSMTAIIRKNLSGWTLLGQGASSPALLDAAGSTDNVESRVLNDLGDFEERQWFYTVPIEDADTGCMRLKLIAD